MTPPATPSGVEGVAETPDHNCIICMQDDGYEIVGPFTSRLDLISCGQCRQDEHNDDPRWQSIYLADPHAMPRVIDPGAAR